MRPGKASAAGAVLALPGGSPIAHAFDLPDGSLAIIEHGWADNYPGSGQPCHLLPGPFEPYGKSHWIAKDTEDGDIIISRHPGKLKPDGPRSKARDILERSLGVNIPAE